MQIFVDADACPVVGIVEEIAGGQKLVRLYDPSGNLIEVRTPFMCN